jgi:hypothetical protein
LHFDVCSHSPHDFQVLTFDEWCEVNRISPRTGRRIITGGDGRAASASPSATIALGSKRGRAREVGVVKARRPATGKTVNGPHGFSAGELRDRKLHPEEHAFQALAVYDGQTCLGFLLPRGKTGVEAFDADDRSLGTFPDLKSAADAIIALSTRAQQ